MKNSVISPNEKISWWRGDLLSDDLITLAIDKSYRDLMRTIRGFSHNPKHDTILKKSKATLYKVINTILNTQINANEVFDILHKAACCDLISAFKGQSFTVGQAQKWINMSFKNLHLLDYPGVEKIYEYCHVPVDNYILRATGYTMSKAWSKLDSYEEYLDYQEWFRERYPSDIPLDKEFYLWLTEAKKQNKS